MEVAIGEGLAVRVLGQHLGYGRYRHRAVDLDVLQLALAFRERRVAFHRLSVEERVGDPVAGLNALYASSALHSFSLYCFITSFFE